MGDCPITNNMIYDWVSYCRAVCMLSLEDKQIGGPNHKCKIGRRKFFDIGQVGEEFMKKKMDSHISEYLWNQDCENRCADFKNTGGSKSHAAKQHMDIVSRLSDHKRD